ncbi:MAG: PAS domain S-box protein, partial [Burkholderiales bacterium]|nr:PAS domain S-box protein [Burkholderiales bacterium]
YAGAPLHARNGHALGTLCLIDSEPRDLSEADRAALRDLADCVEREFFREEQQRQHHALLALTGITSFSHHDPHAALRQALNMACDYLGMGSAQIVRIHSTVSTSAENHATGSASADVLVCASASLCDAALILRLLTTTDPTSPDHLTAISDLRANSAFAGLPEAMDAGSLIGLRMLIGIRHDTSLCFYDPAPRPFAFSDVEKEFVRLLADWVSGVIKRQELDHQLQRQRMLSESIAVAQSLFIRETDQAKGFESLLTAILKLTDSSCGFLCEVKNTFSTHPALNSMMLAWKNEDADDVSNTENADAALSYFSLIETARDQACQQLRANYGAALQTGQATIDNAVGAQTLDQIFPAHLAPLQNFLCVPVLYDDALIALVGIGNRDRGFDTALMDFLQPLFSTLGQLISAARMQRQRSDTERQLANVIKGTNIGTWECNVVTGETVYNERWAEMLGYTLAELQPTTVDTWLNLCHPEDLKITAAMVEQHFRGEIEYFDLKSRMRHKDGHWVWIHDRGCVVSWSADGQPLIMSGSHADITAQMEAEAELEHAYELLERSNAAARIGTWELDVAPLKLHWSSVTKQIHEVGPDFVCTAEEALAFYKGAESQQLIRDLFVKAVREGTPIDREFCITTARGHERWVQVTGFPQYHDGVCTRIYGTFQDISERMSAEESLRDQAAHTGAIVDNVLDGIITFDEDEHILSANRAAAQIFAYPAADMPGMNMRQLIPETPSAAGNPDASQADIHRIIGIGREVEARRQDGALFPLDLSVSAVRRQGRPLYIALMRDITERKRNEQIKNEFISTVSHELRTPLTSISGALGLLSGGVYGNYSANTKQMIDIANKNCQRLSFLINDLLDMEKLSAGKMVFRMEQYHLGDLLNTAVEANQTFGAQRSVTLNLSAQLPEAKINVDSQRFMQVLSNLLSNAIKYSPENGVVDILAERKGHRVEISVIDRGSGIPPAFRDRIFQKFAQADSSDTRLNGGTGLGLAITRELVERMGGAIGFDSAPGQLTRFHIELPVVG